MSAEQRLLGGNVSSVVRVGDTVRRSTGPWTQVVHELLQHLEDVGFPFSPRALGIDEQGREVLSFIDGETVGPHHPWPSWAWADGTLVQAARLMRDYHEAVSEFRPRGIRTWRFTVGAVEPGEIVCHNDIAPYNLVYRDGRIVGLIDWDLAGPGQPIWDLAFSAWAFAPIHTAEHSRRLGAPTDVPRRLRLLYDSYGLVERDQFLDLVMDRIEASVTGIQTKAAAGDEALTRLIAEGHVTRMNEDITWLSEHLVTWQKALG